jgi:hypothetical protein
MTFQLSRSRSATRRRYATRLLTAGALVAVGSVAVAFDASATIGDDESETAEAPVARIVTVTPTDRIELQTVGGGSTSAFAEALEARQQLVASEPEPEPEAEPEPKPKPEPSAEAQSTGGSESQAEEGSSSSSSSATGSDVKAETSSSSSSTSYSTDGPIAIETWERVAQCESNGRWQHVSANGLYYGGLQFAPSTWEWVGGTGMPHHASREEQIHRAQKLWQLQGWDAWPACSTKLGLR